MLDPASDYGIKYESWGVETIQDVLTSDECCKRLLEKEKPDVIIASFIVEHVCKFDLFMATLKQLLNPSGYILVQVPDFEYSMEKEDYASIWEEHILYFTRTSFLLCPYFAGFNNVFFKRIQHAAGRILVSAWRSEKKIKKADTGETGLTDSFKAAMAYKECYHTKKKAVKKELTDFIDNNEKIAVFGAGHQSCMFINLFDLKSEIAFVVDDDINKKDLFMPGSGIQIKGSESLIEDNIKLCLLGVSPELHPIIIEKNQAFVAQKGVFKSIYEIGSDIR